KGEILSGFGRYVFKNAEPRNKVIVICADYDGTDAKTHEALLNDQQALIAKGYNVHVVWPATAGEKKIDFNDILMTGGPEKIKIILKEQLPEVVRFEASQRSRTNVIGQKDVLEKDQSREQAASIVVGPRVHPTANEYPAFGLGHQNQKTSQES